MCSANATDEDKRDAKESGAVSFLSKPYTPAQLDTILQAIDQGTAAILMDEPSARPTASIPKPTVVEKDPVPAPAAPC